MRWLSLALVTVLTVTGLAVSATMGGDYHRARAAGVVSGPGVVAPEPETVSGGAVSEAVSGAGVTEAVTGSGITLDRYEATVYILDQINWAEASFKVSGLSADADRTLTCASSNTKMDLEIAWSYYDPNCFYIYTYNSGHTTATVTVGGKEFTIDLQVVRAPINHSSKVLDLGKSVKLKVKNYPFKPVWKSSDGKVATVDKSGKVRAKKVGNTIVYTDIDGNRTGCIISVVKKGISKVVKRASYIGTNWSYSQPRRMCNKYYDCSSLVWKAYRTSGRYVCGTRNFAPVAADIGRWCVNRKRRLGRFDESNIQELLYLPGDVLLKVHMRGDRYMGIGHIEMITGYSLHGFVGRTPVIFLTWGARDEGYGASSKDDFVGRPYN